jgi:type VI protein secretion system component VasF
MNGRVSAAMLRWALAWQGPSGRWRRDERGDVPGWVMIVVMTAAIVVALTAIAREQLSDMLRSALDSVTD